MKKKTSFSTKGKRADIGDLSIYRILANRYADAVGPFVLLDHIVQAIYRTVLDETFNTDSRKGSNCSRRLVYNDSPLEIAETYRNFPKN